jgi:hypothetical protein
MEDELVTPVIPVVNTDLVYDMVIDPGQLYTDLKRRLPVRSNKGSWYRIVLYSFHCNYIIIVPMKSHSSTEWLTEYGRVH